jgi:hypothetical protein
VRQNKCYLGPAQSNPTVQLARLDAKYVKRVGIQLKGGIRMNSVIIVVMIVIGVVLYVSLADLRRIFLIQNSALSGQHAALEEKFQGLEEQLSRLEEKIDSVENNTLSKLQRECRAFERGRPLTLAMIRALKSGETLQLISKSYVYPSDEPEVARFAYKHDYLDESKPSKYGYEVHGHWRISGSADWQPCNFLTSEKESQTITCAGTIRQL